MQYNEVFEKFDIFEGLDEMEKKLLSGLFERRTYKEDETIYKEGESGGTLYLLLAGKVRICKETKDGDLLPYATVRAGETFGLMSFVDGRDHAAITIADKDSEIVKLEKKDFEYLIEKDPVMAAKVYKRIGIHLCEIIRDMNRQYMDLSTYMFTKSK